MKKLKKHILHSIQPMTKREEFVARGQERHFDKINEIVEWINNHDKGETFDYEECKEALDNAVGVDNEGCQGKVPQQEKECPHDHLCCPGDIKTVRCAYCGKSMYQEPTPTKDYQLGKER